eukprot:2375605-Rhodomonas_salina.6
MSTTTTARSDCRCVTGSLAHSQRVQPLHTIVCVHGDRRCWIVAATPSVNGTRPAYMRRSTRPRTAATYASVMPRGGVSYWKDGQKKAVRMPLRLV